MVFISSGMLSFCSALLLLQFAIPQTLTAQHLRLELDTVIQLKCSNPHFGGISAIEYLADQNLTLLITDKDEHGGTSHAFIMYKYDSIVELTGNFTNLGNYNAAGMKEIESFRYNKHQKKFYFSFERDNTGFGYIDKQSRQKIIFKEAMPSNNRGIESLTINDKNELWIAEESGKSTSCTNDTFTWFYKFIIGAKGEYGNIPKAQFKYPLTRCNCTNGKRFDSNAGNGVSEILALDASRFLVLERCWNGVKGSATNVSVYLATVHERDKTITKEHLCSVDSLLKEKGIRCDNLEGMTWSKPVNGQRRLYLVSDDNFRTHNPDAHLNQVTQLIVLREVR